VFSIVFREDVTREQILRFVDALALFKIGYSWGGVTSLAMPFFELPRSHPSYGERVVRLNIGLEDVGDLLADLEQALRQIDSKSAARRGSPAADTHT
jgi:cystathionine beta-lyase